VTRLIVDAGPHSGLTVPLVGEMLIGRDAGACQVVLDRDPGVSRQHARVLPGPTGAWIYRDLKSANGSWLATPGRERQRLTADYILADGDRIELGASGFLFRFEVFAASATVVGLAAPVESATLVHARAEWPTEVAYLIERAGGGRSVRLGLETTLGRGRDCELIVEAADVSRRHASIAYEDGRFVLRDLGSANGTFMMRAQHLRKVEVPVPLQHGDTVLLGSTQLGFVDTTGHPEQANGAPARPQELVVEIDQEKKARATAQIMDTEYFKDLRARALKMRRREG
jgi:pSer/pThr/pTyr-binding forkhead associated (FHA) protein